MMEAIKIVKEDIQLGDIGQTIQDYVEKEGFSVVQDFCGQELDNNSTKNQMSYTMVPWDLRKD